MNNDFMRLTLTELYGMWEKLYAKSETDGSTVEERQAMLNRLHELLEEGKRLSL